MWIDDESVMIRNMVIMALIVAIVSGAILYLDRGRRPLVHGLFALGIGLAFGLFSAVPFAYRDAAAHHNAYSTKAIIWHTFAYNGGIQEAIFALLGMAASWASLEVYRVILQLRRT